MTLRARLVAAFTILLLVALATLGVVATRSTRAVLLAQADEDLREVEARLAVRPGAPSGLGRQGDNVVARGFALLVVDATGAVIDAAPAGFADDPDPLPAISSLRALSDSPGKIATIDSEDGSLDYRAIAIPTDSGDFHVWAVPIDDIDAATARLIRWLIGGGAVVATVGAVATWWIVRRDLRPVDTMVDTAAAIAAGDLTRRVPDQNPSTELGRLGVALNEMLARLDDAFNHERASQEKLNQFVADASHELRTPLAALQGYAELYRKNALADPADLDNAMHRIRKESGRMQRLVDDLLLLARLDRGQSMDSGTVDVVPVVLDAIADSQAIEPDRVVTYDGPSTASVRGDEHRLAQVVANLLANARSHTPKATPVSVTVTRSDEAVAIEVADSGPGIPEDHPDQLFDRFHRGDPSRARQTGGAGLGLAIVAAIVEAHDGTVTAANRPDRGARFTINLPGAPTISRSELLAG